MAQHGYLREYDEAPDRDEDRDQGGWRERGERDWQGREGQRNERDRDRDRGWMLSDDEHRRPREHGEDRGFFSRIGDEARGWFSDDEHDNRHSRSAWEGSREWPQRSRGGYGQGRSAEGNQGQREFSSHPDDHYRSWRDRQMQALDRDYADYCREREQQFHSEFDTWRQNRRQQQQQGASAEQSRQGSSSEDVMELRNPAWQAGEVDSVPDPMSEATLGTNNTENSGPAGRRGS